jgi:hypothetical protein
MEQRTPQSYEFVRIAVMLITLASLAFVCFYLVSSAFDIDSATGIRSIAGIMLPLVLGGFLAVFKRSLFEKAARVSPTIAFLLAAVFAVAIMLLIKNIDALRVAPIAEIIVAAGLTILLYSPGSMPGFVQATDRSDVWMAYYFGMVSGMLGYIVLMGFPI